MELEECLLKRRSVRKFTSEKVKEEDIDKILHAAMSGPTAMNQQPWEFYVITNENKIKELKKASKYTGYDAPLGIVVIGNMKKALPLNMKEFWVQDCSAATENILLAATSLGLGSVWCGIYPMENAVKNMQNILKLKDYEIPLNLVWIGHPNINNEPRDQFETDKIVFIK